MHRCRVLGNLGLLLGLVFWVAHVWLQVASWGSYSCAVQHGVLTLE